MDLQDLSSQHSSRTRVRPTPSPQWPPIWNSLAHQASLRDQLRYYQTSPAWFTLEDSSIWLPPWSGGESYHGRYVEHINAKWQPKQLHIMHASSTEFPFLPSP